MEKMIGFADTKKNETMKGGEEMINEYLIRIRRALHMNPEVGFELKDTCALVKKELETIGLVADETYGRSSITALLEVNEPIMTIGLRADMDAINISELSDKKYKSKKDGVSHTCGHDAHTAMLLGVAKTLVKEKDRLRCNIRFIFQASEEGPESGAKYMVEDGIMDDIDYIFGMHVDNRLDTGNAGVIIDKAMASGMEFSVEIIGKGGHSGFPHLANDAIAMAAKIINDTQYIVAREISPFEPAVVSIGTIHGGTVPNAIAEKVELSGTTRTFSKEMTDYLKNRFESIVKKATEDLGGSYNVKFDEGYLPVINRRDITLKVADLVKNCLGDENFTVFYEGLMASEDFSYYLDKKPGCYLMLGTGNDEKALRVLQHNPRFDIDEDAMVYGVDIFVNLALHFKNYI